jgi:hypothetical protein
MRLLLPLQLAHEFRLLLLLGRTLCHRQPGVSMTCTRLMQHRAADGSISERQVDLMFPATEKTVLRLNPLEIGDPEKSLSQEAVH